jgi:hypothetical protein
MMRLARRHGARVSDTFVSSKVEFDRKDLKTPDAFFETLGSANRYLQSHRSRVIAVATILVAVFVAAISLYRWMQHRADETAAAFLRATDALDLDSLSTARTALENMSASAGGVYGELAKLYEADIAVREKRWDDALPRYDEVSRKGDTAYIRQIALLGKAHVLENKGDTAAAAAAYAEAAETDGPFHEQALRDQLRAAKAAGKNDVAAAAINAILDKYPDTPDADDLASELPALGGQQRPAQAEAEATQPE